MTDHILPVLSGTSRTTSSALPGGDRGFPIEIDVALGGRRVGTNTWRVLDGHHLTASPIGIDLYRLAV